MCVQTPGMSPSRRRRACGWADPPSPAQLCWWASSSAATAPKVDDLCYSQSSARIAEMQPLPAVSQGAEFSSHSPVSRAACLQHACSSLSKACPHSLQITKEVKQRSAVHVNLYQVRLRMSFVASSLKCGIQGIFLCESPMRGSSTLLLRMQNLPLEQVEVLGDFNSSGLAVPVCNGAGTSYHAATVIEAVRIRDVNKF